MTAAFDSFVMFGGMRTGSNLLEANLNALDGVTCHGEAFNPHFIGRLNQTALFGIDLAARDADPRAMIRRLRAETAGLSGFRFFHDHDPRVFDAVMADPRCAKIVLTRNPLESYVSWEIARATGQWKLTSAKRLRPGKARFDGPAFARFLGELQAFHLRILRGLQTAGQTAFWIDYDDLSEVDVLNGLAAWLGVAARLDAPDTTLKKQNPGPLTDRVENPEAIPAALAALDRFNLSRTPNFEPRRGPLIPSYMAAGPVLYMPVRGGPEARVAEWLAGIGPVARDLNQRALRRWQSAPGPRRSLTVLRHPLARAHAAFAEKVLTGALPEIRTAFQRVMQVRLPPPDRAGTMDAEGHRDAFLAFLRFARMNLAGQTALRVDAHLASQTAALQGFAQHQPPDLVLREDRLAEGLAFVAAEVGLPCPPLPPAAAPASPPCDAEVQAAARDAYLRDYIGLGFADWPAP